MKTKQQGKRRRAEQVESLRGKAKAPKAPKTSTPAPTRESGPAAPKGGPETSRQSGSEQE